MIRWLLVGLGLLTASMPALAQSAADPNLGLRVTYDRANALYTFSWWGEAGKAYRVKYSLDLTTWISLPAIVLGHDHVESWTYPGPERRWFLWVEKIDDPLDIDGDRMRDSWEMTHFGNLDHDGSGDTDIDGLSDLEEFANGGDPNSTDTDGDGVSDGDDAVANDPDFKHRRRPLSHYAVIELPVGVNFWKVNDLGQILAYGEVWQAGEMVPVEGAEHLNNLGWVAGNYRDGNNLVIDRFLSKVDGTGYRLPVLEFSGTIPGLQLAAEAAEVRALDDANLVYGTSTRLFSGEPYPDPDPCVILDTSESITKGTRWDPPLYAGADYPVAEKLDRSSQQLSSLGVVQYRHGDVRPWDDGGAPYFVGLNWVLTVGNRSLGKYTSGGLLITAESVTAYHPSLINGWTTAAYHECPDVTTRSSFTVQSPVVTINLKINDVTVETLPNRSQSETENPWELPILLTWRNGATQKLVSGVADGVATLWVETPTGYKRKPLKETPVSAVALTGLATKVNNLGQAIIQGNPKSFWQNGTAYNLNDLVNYGGGDVGVPIDISDNTGLILTYAPTGDKLLLAVELVEVTPALKDEAGAEIPNSTKPKNLPQANDMVEEPITDQIPKVAYRVLKVKVPKELLAGEKVKWSMTPQFTPEGESQPRFRGVWPTAHPDQFEAAPNNPYGFERTSQTEGRTTIDSEGYFAARINLPPIGYNKARVKLEFEKYPGAYSEIDFEVPAVVVIDPGHGGTVNEPGSSANNATSPTGVKEKDLALSYGLALRDALKAKVQQDKLNAKVLMTRTIDKNVAGTERAHVARDNGADAVFVIHFNASDPPHSARGTLEVRQLPSQVNLAEDVALIDPIITSIVAAITPFDAGANKRAFVPTDTSVAFDPKLGNTAAYHPIRVGYCEVEFLDNAAVDVLLNTGPNAGVVKTAIVSAMRDGVLRDLKRQPAAP